MILEVTGGWLGSNPAVDDVPRTRGDEPQTMATAVLNKSLSPHNDHINRRSQFRVIFKIRQLLCTFH
jgi:hypothetical protein